MHDDDDDGFIAQSNEFHLIFNQFFSCYLIREKIIFVEYINEFN